MEFFDSERTKIESSRRRALAIFTTTGITSLSGCSSIPDIGPQRSINPKVVEINNQDIVEDQHEVAFEVSIIENRITIDHPPQIRIKLTNEGEERYFPELERGVVFDHERVTHSDPVGLLLIWSEISKSLDVSDPPWSTDPADMSEGSSGVPGTVLKSGESVQNKYMIWDNSSVEKYFKPDNYRFETKVKITSSASKPSTVLSDFEWGFTISVKEV